MTALFLRHLALVWLLLPFTATQSFVGGDLSNQAPYGIPPGEFIDATSKPVSSAMFPIVGYNTSLPAGNAIGTSGNVSGWFLNISVAPDVALSDASDGSVDKSKVTEATTLSLQPPTGMAFDNSSWRLCAVVFPGGLQSTAAGGSLDGSCAAVLPSDCIRQLQIGGMETDDCENLTVPQKCMQYIAPENGSAFELTSTVVSAKRFFAAGSVPTASGNKSAVAAAQARIWPVLLKWGLLGANGEPHDGVAWISCVKAPNSTSGGSPGSGNAAGSVVGELKWTHLWAIGLAVLLLAA